MSEIALSSEVVPCGDLGAASAGVGTAPGQAKALGPV
jgi:hypothetical protein